MTTSADKSKQDHIFTYTSSLIKLQTNQSMQERKSVYYFTCLHIFCETTGLMVSVTIMTFILFYFLGICYFLYQNHFI